MANTRNFVQDKDCPESSTNILANLVSVSV